MNGQSERDVATAGILQGGQNAAGVSHGGRRRHLQLRSYDLACLQIGKNKEIAMTPACKKPFMQRIAGMGEPSRKFALFFKKAPFIHHVFAFSMWVVCLLFLQQLVPPHFKHLGAFSGLKTLGI